MRTIQELTGAQLARYVDITANAYPGIKIVTAEEKERTRQRTAAMAADPGVRLYGLFEEGEMLGVMRCHDFTMQLFETRALVGGLGGVAVDLLHKKEKVARDMVHFFLRDYRARGACLTALYPFRPDFYRQMGFGYGTKLTQYSITPDSLPRGAAKGNVRFLAAADRPALLACYDRVMTRTHGLMAKQDSAVDGLFQSAAARIAGCWEDGELRGYLVFTFRPTRDDNFLAHDLLVRELIYETPAALAALLTFLHTQADQVARIQFQTQDESFYFLLRDPRNGTGNILPSVWHESNVQGVGLMYRVIDVPRLFEVLGGHDFGGQSCRLRVELADSFLPENAGVYGVGVENGRFHPVDAATADVSIALDVAEFSALVTGVVGFRQLVEYGLAAISDAQWLDVVHRLFHAAQPPRCLTSF